MSTGTRWAAVAAGVALLALATTAMWVMLTGSAKDEPRAAASTSASPTPSDAAEGTSPSPADPGDAGDASSEPDDTETDSDDTETDSDDTDSSASGPSTCEVFFDVVDSWHGGYKAEVTVRQRGPATDGWDLAWRFEDGQRIEDLWQGVVVKPAEGEKSADVVVRNASYNGTIATGESVSFGFVAKGEPVPPARFYLSGQECSPGAES